MLCLFYPGARYFRAKRTYLREKGWCVAAIQPLKCEENLVDAYEAGILRNHDEELVAQYGQSLFHSSRMLAMSGSRGNSSWEHSDFNFVTWLRAYPSLTSIAKASKLIPVQRRPMTSLTRRPVQAASKTIER